jgi:hypothetical protein
MQTLEAQVISQQGNQIFKFLGCQLGHAIILSFPLRSPGDHDKNHGRSQSTYSRLRAVLNNPPQKKELVSEFVDDIH